MISMGMAVYDVRDREMSGVADSIGEVMTDAGWCVDDNDTLGRHEEHALILIVCYHVGAATEGLDTVPCSVKRRPIQRSRNRRECGHANSPLRGAKGYKEAQNTAKSEFHHDSGELLCGKGCGLRAGDCR